MNALKCKRLEIGLKQIAVAKRLGMSRRHYQRFENEGLELSDKRKLEIAKIFNCSVSEISQKEV